MAGLISTGIWGFLTSAKATGKQVLNAAGDLIPEWVSTFVSGASGWMIDKLGNAEFKSVYCRDKFITNEFVYNRIRVTEEEEIVSSNGKILSSIDNGDGTFTVFLDLSEGSFNPFSNGDLLMGYYHDPGSSLSYSVQKMTLTDDPSTEDQSMLLICEEGCNPYPHMIVVRIGNNFDVERQAFIKISSRTNCQYFYDEITSFADLNNPDKIKCVLGKADMGLIPAWAAEAVGSVKKWFGLIADSVIIRGTFILHNDKTIEDELNGREIQLRSDFQIREDGITGKWEEVIKYAKDASDSATSASGSADAAGEHEKRVEELASEFNVNAEKLSADFSEKVTTETTTALGVINTATEKATGSLQLTARDFTLAFTQVVETKTEEATGTIAIAKEEAESSIKLTAKDLNLAFNSAVETKTIEATGAIKTAKENAESGLVLSAKNLTANFDLNVETKTREANGAISTAKETATSELELTAKNLTTTFEETAEARTIAATGEISSETEKYKSELNVTAQELTTKFEQSVTDAEGDIVKEIGTQVTQSAKEWKVEVMGSDAQGNPNTILAAINADESGVQINGDRVQITGELLAEIIKASGININDKFIVDKNGNVSVAGYIQEYWTSITYGIDETRYIELKTSIY